MNARGEAERTRTTTRGTRRATRGGTGWYAGWNAGWDARMTGARRRGPGRASFSLSSRGLSVHLLKKRVGVELTETSAPSRLAGAALAECYSSWVQDVLLSHYCETYLGEREQRR